MDARVAFVALLLLSGCLVSQEPRPTPSTSPTPDLETDIVQANNATACTRTFPAIMVDRLHAQTFLPTGFTAAEASTFFAMPDAPANRALLIVSIMRCRSSTWAPGGYEEAMGGIFVRPPTVNGSVVRGEHFYDLGRVYHEGPVAETLERVGWPRLGHRLKNDYAGQPSRAADAVIEDANGTVFTASLPSAQIEDSFTGTLHLYWWQRTEDGLGHFEYTFRPEGFLGTGSCAARAGTILARVLQSTSCSALFMVGPPYDVVGRFEFDWEPTPQKS